MKWFAREFKNNMSDYHQMTDEKLIEQLRTGDEDIMDYICTKYKPLVLKKAKYMFLIGGETEDLIQEGMLGLFKAIRDFDPAKNVTFYHFAQMCISGQINKAIEANNRMKNQPLNTYVSIFSNDEQEGDSLDEILDTQEALSPEKILIDSENVQAMRSKVMDSLSDLERQVLELYLQGYDYHSIASQMNKTDKAIDNALQRIRQKVKKII